MFGRLKEQPPAQSLVGGTGVTTTPVEGESGPSGPPEGLILLVFVVLTLAASAFVLTRAADKLERDPAQKASRGEVKGLDSLSMLRTANLKRALAKVDSSSYPLISNLRVSAARVDVTARDNDGSRKLMSIDPGLNVTTRDFGVGEDQAVRSERINAAAPERMARSVAERTGLSPDAVDYVTTSFSGSGMPTWYLALNQGPARIRGWIAAPDGSDLRKPGELSQAQKDENDRRRRQAEAEQRRIKRVLARRRACLIKARDVYAASRCVQENPL